MYLYHVKHKYHKPFYLFFVVIKSDLSSSRKSFLQNLMMIIYILECSSSSLYSSWNHFLSLYNIKTTHLVNGYRPSRGGKICTGTFRIKVRTRPDGMREGGLGRCHSQILTRTLSADFTRHRGTIFRGTVTYDANNSPHKIFIVNLEQPTTKTGQ